MNDPLCGECQSGSKTDLARLFPGDGGMVHRMRAFDWSATPLGLVESWPQNLRIALGICLTSRFPIFLWWGSSMVTLYNDAYIPFLGKFKHPAMLCQPAWVVWPEIWSTIGPMLEAVWATGKASWSEDMQLFFDRDLPKEELFCTFSYSPLLGENNKVEGIFCACTALEAMLSGGVLTIRTYAKEDAIILEVEDIGPGIPADILKQLGTPFLTTKETGTGLGLSVCYRIAQRHGAKIDVKTSPQGATFMVSFPM